VDVLAFASLPRISWSFIGRRWFEFRYGHTLYLVFLMSFTNFILIVYNLGFGGSLEFPVWVFAIIFLFLYVPLAVLIGYLHRTRQLRIDMVKQWEQNPYFRELLSDVKEIRKTLEEMKGKDVL